MLFTPYNDEAKRIELLKKYVNTDYTVIRLTNTMINKNNIDANYFMRTLLRRKKVVDYDKLANGGNKGVKLATNIFSNNHHIKTMINFYRVKGKRSDPRFSIYGIKKYVQDNILHNGDFLVIFPYAIDNSIQIFIFNTSYQLPSERILSNIMHLTPAEQKLNELLPKIKAIAKQGYHPNSKGSGKVSPKDAGDTLESLLGVKTNNRKNADIEGMIELKTKSRAGLDTLFTLRPRFDNTPVAQIESKDRSRVAAYTRMYGYLSDKHPNSMSLYVTIGSVPNNQGLYLNVNENKEVVELKKGTTVTAFWRFEDLEHELQIKHPMTLWFDVQIDRSTEEARFLYKSMKITQAPSFETFINLIDDGIITYDWRGYTSISGKYQGKNHGNAWRIDKKNLTKLFGETESIDLQS